MLINDKGIIISAAGSRKATFWPQQKLYWSELVERLKTSARGTETLADYLSYPKAKQDELKDVKRGRLRNLLKLQTAKQQDECSK